jgi:hypothetical protein
VRALLFCALAGCFDYPSLSAGLRDLATQDLSGQDLAQNDLASADLNGSTSGFIFVENGSPNTRAGAFFRPSSDCTFVVQDSPCFIVDCPTNNTVSSDGGPIQVSGLAKPLNLNFANGSYTSTGITATDTLWSGSEPLSFSSSGSASFMPFTVQLNAPHQVTVTAPAHPGSADLVVSRSNALAVSWSGGTPGEFVSFQLEESSPGGGVTSLKCRFDAAGGSGQVLPSLLIHVPTGSGGYFIGTDSDAVKLVGTGSVEAEAIIYGKNSTGALFVGGATVQ